MNGLVQSLLATIVVTLLFILADSAVVFVTNPIQAIWFSDVTAYASLFYLPAAVRIFSTSLLGSKAIPGLFLGMLLSSHYLWGVDDLELLITLSIMGALVTWVTFRVLALLGIDPFYLNTSDSLPSLNTFFIAAISVATVDAFFLCAILEQDKKITHIMLHFAAFAMGDLIGFLIGLLIIKCGMPIFRYVVGLVLNRDISNQRRSY